MKRRCPQLRAAALRDGTLPSAEHAAHCAECSAERAALTSVLELARELPWTPPAADRVESIRAAAISALPPQSPRSVAPWMMGLAAALLLAVAAGVALRTSPSAPTPALLLAKVGAAATARFVQTAADGAQPERVRLQSGTIELEVAHLGPGERFVVQTDDAEVEVRGTTFTVEAVSGALTSVRVLTGRVEVRRRGDETVLLSAGEEWSPSSELALSPEAELPLPEVPEASPAKVQPVRKARRAVAEVPKNERAFRDAWAAFARGDLDEAVELFATAEEASPRASLAEDACYGRAVALQRLDRHEESIAEMRRFMKRYATSVRADEVSVALGWALLDRGNSDEATKLFERGRQSTVARVRRSAERGAEEALRRQP